MANGGKMSNVTVVPMDDYALVLGMKFLDLVETFLIPYANTMCIMQDGKPCIVPINREYKPTNVLSTM